MLAVLQVAALQHEWEDWQVDQTPTALNRAEMGTHWVLGPHWGRCAHWQ